MAVPNGRVIHAPGSDVMDMLGRRMPTSCRKKLEGLCTDAVGLVQADVVTVIYLADIAQKAAPVCPVELNRSCPQHIVGLALFGGVSAVETAMEAIKRGGCIPSGGQFA